MRDLALVSVLVPLLAMAAARPFVGVLAWSWISFMNPHQEVWGFATTQPWAMLSFVAMVFGCFVAREPKKPAVNAVTVLLAAFAGVITITSITALGAPSMTWPKWDRIFKVLIGLQLTAALLTDKRRVHALVWLMAISMGFYGVKGGVFTLMTGGGFIVKGPANSMIADRNHLSTALLVAMPLMNYLRAQSRHPLIRAGLMFAMGTTLFAVVGSQSRGALLGLAATGLMLWLRSRGKITSGIFIVLGSAVAINFMPEKWVARMQTLETYDEDASAMGRVRIWEAAWLLALRRPLVGGGFRAVYQQDIVNTVAPHIRARATHSIWFEALGEHGFPGFLVWLGVIIAGVVLSMRVTKMTKDRPDLAWASDLARMSQVSVVAYASGGTFLSLAYWDFFWTLMVVVGATYRLVAQAVRAPAPDAAAAALPRGTGWRAQAGPTLATRRA